MSFRWSRSPSAMTAKLVAKMAGVEGATRGLASTHAARAQGVMQGGAAWMDITGFARSSLYGRAEGTDIHLGTTNAEYGVFLELGTVHMAPRPIIEPTLRSTAQEYFRDVQLLVRSALSG